jgi:hypothetical protein
LDQSNSKKVKIRDVEQYLNEGSQKANNRVNFLDCFSGINHSVPKQQRKQGITKQATKLVTQNPSVEMNASINSSKFNSTLRKDKAILIP